MVSGDIHQTRDAEPHRSISNNTDLQPGGEAPLAENKVMGAIYPSCLLGNESEPVTREASDKKPLGAITITITIAVPKHPLGSMLLVEGVFSWDTNSSCKPKQSCSTDGAGMKKAACAAFVAANQNTRRLFLPSVTPTDE